MKRLIARFVATLTFLLVASAGIADGVEGVSITYLGQVDANFETWYTQLAEEFERETGIKVELDLTNSNRVGEKLVTLVLAGTPPDIVGADMSQLLGFDLQNTFVDLAPYLEREGLPTSVFPPAVVDSVTLPDGRLIGLPFSLWTFGAAFNKTLFNELGLPEPTDGWTWDDLAEIAQRATQDTSGDGQIDRYGWNLPSAWTRWQPVVLHGGGNFLDRRSSPTRSTLLTPEVRNAFEFIGSLSTRGAVATGWEHFPSGSAAISYDAGTNMELRVEGRFEMGWIPYAKGPGDATGGEITPLFHGILLTSPEREAAWKWIEYLSYNYEAQLSLALITERIPALAPAANDFFNQQAERNRSILYLLEQVMDPTSYTRYHEWTEAMNLLQTWIRRALVEQSIPVYEALLQADEQINALLAEGR